MKNITNHLGEIIVSLAAIVLIISVVTFTSPGLTGFFSEMTDTIMLKASDMLNGIGTPNAGTSGGGGGNEPGQLPAPTIMLSGDTLLITPVANATSYEVYNGNKLVLTTTETTVELPMLFVSSNAYSINVKATSDTLPSSAPSSTINYNFTNVSLNPKGTIPQGGQYTTSGGLVYEAGEEFPGIFGNGDLYTYGDYIYKYNYQQSNAMEWELNATQNGWGVVVRNKNQASYGAILESINNKPIVSLKCTFKGANYIQAAPAIPNTVTNMEETFSYCKILKDISNVVLPAQLQTMNNTFAYCEVLIDASGLEIPNTVTDMGSTFIRCIKLKKGPESIPSSVKSMYRCFYECYALEVAPDFTNATNLENMEYCFYQCKAMKAGPNYISSTVTNMRGAFCYCSSLSGELTIDASNLVGQGADSVFAGVDFATQNITLSGSSTLLHQLGSTGRNFCMTCLGTCADNH